MLVIDTFRRRLKSSNIFAVPMTTEVSGSAANETGRLVSDLNPFVEIFQ